MISRLHLLALVCCACVADTGAQTDLWRQCLADTSPAAVHACSEVIRINPRNDGAFVNRGIAYRRGGDLGRAIHDYDAAIALNPAAADAFNNRGNARRDERRHDLALADYDAAIRLKPQYAHAYNNRGIVYMELGDSARAVEDFARAIALDPGYANAFRNRGLARMEQRLYGLAVADFDEAFRLDARIGRGAEYPLALYGRGAARLRNGDAGGQADIEESRRLVPSVGDLFEPAAAE